MRKIERKGNITINEVITTVIAVIGLVLLGLAIIKIYGNFANQESKNAQTNLDSLVTKIEALGSDGISSIGLAGPSEKWFLAGWNANEAGRPDKCYLGSCVCICNGILNEDTKATVCQSSGFCKILKDKNVNVVEKGILLVNGSDCKEGNKLNIRLTKNLVSLTISLKGDNIEVARIFSQKECEQLYAAQQKSNNQFGASPSA